MKYAILFLTLLSVHNLIAYWKLDYRVKELSDIRPSKSKEKAKAIKSHRAGKSLSRAKF